MAPAESGRPKKLLFLTVPLKGHLVHTARLSEWFLQYPDDYEVHVGAGKSTFEFLPEGVVAHVNEGSTPESEEKLAAGMQAGAAGRDQYDSNARMVEAIDMTSMVVPLMFAVHTVRDVKPDVVIADHSYGFGNYLHTYCRSQGIPLVVITSMGRAETMLKPYNMAMMLLQHFSVMKRAFGKLNQTFSEVEAVVGPPLPNRDLPVTIFPSAQVLVEDAPQRNEFFTGPFLPLPSLVEESPARHLRRSSSFSVPLSQHPELKQWMSEASDSGLAIIYIALGTLVKPSKDLIERLIAGLDGGPWRILWALPKAQQDLLPRKLSDHWYVDNFLPQFALFRTGLVQAFISHCGASSTNEALCQGIPMICMPFFGDQYEWAVSVCKFVKAGVQIDKHKSTPGQIRQAVSDVLQKPHYKENALAVSRKVAERARIRLTWLQHHWSEHRVALEKDMKVGVPVAAAVIDACLKKQDPKEVIPRFPARSGTCTCCG